MLDAGTLDVIMGAGNPDFDNDGRPLRDEKHRDYQWVGGPETWKALKSGQRRLEADREQGRIRGPFVRPYAAESGRHGASGRDNARETRPRPGNVVAAGIDQSLVAPTTAAAVRRAHQSQRAFLGGDDQGSDPLPRT